MGICSITAVIALLISVRSSLASRARRGNVEYAVLGNLDDDQILNDNSSM